MERYDACPTGWTVGYSEVGHDGNRAEPNKCEQTRNVCLRQPGQKIAFKSIKDGDSCEQTVSMSRPMRQKPWFIEYTDAKGSRQKA